MATLPLSVLTARYAREFRAAAESFRRIQRDQLGAATNPPRLAELAVEFRRLVKSCGKFLTGAADAGVIPAEQVDLLELIEIHRDTAKNLEPLPPGSHARLIRCPDNLFMEIVGGHEVCGVFRGFDDRGRVILTESARGGGWAPAVVPAHLDSPGGNVRASTCDLLADLMEAGEQAQPDPASAGEPEAGEPEVATATAQRIAEPIGQFATTRRETAPAEPNGPAEGEYGGVCAAKTANRYEIKVRGESVKLAPGEAFAVMLLVRNPKGLTVNQMNAIGDGATDKKERSNDRVRQLWNALDKSLPLKEVIGFRGKGVRSDPKVYFILPDATQHVA